MDLAACRGGLSLEATDCAADPLAEIAPLELEAQSPRGDLGYVEQTPGQLVEAGRLLARRGDSGDEPRIADASRFEPDGEGVEL